MNKGLRSEAFNNCIKQALLILIGMVHRGDKKISTAQGRVTFCKVTYQNLLFFIICHAMCILTSRDQEYSLPR